MKYPRQWVVLAKDNGSYASIGAAIEAFDSFESARANAIIRAQKQTNKTFSVFSLAQHFTFEPVLMETYPEEEGGKR